MNDLSFEVALELVRGLGYIRGFQIADKWAWLSRCVEDPQLKEQYACMHKVIFDASDWLERAHLMEREKRDAA